jgi:hypothetical protein
LSLEILHSLLALHELLILYFRSGGSFGTSPFNSTHDLVLPTLLLLFIVFGDCIRDQSVDIDCGA